MKTYKTLQTLAAAILIVAMPLIASAADEPEAIYAKFHRAGLAANFDEMLKYGTAQKGVEDTSMPVEMRQAMLNFLAQMLPKSYSVASKTIDPNGNHATLRVTAMQSQHPGDIPETVNGTITLIKENGDWKVDEAKWGEPSKISEPVDHSTLEDVDVSTWADVQKDNSIYAYDVYLNMFPKGKYSELAKNRIKKLQDEATSKTSHKE